MMILISCAKIMSTTKHLDHGFETVPYFKDKAAQIAFYMSQFGITDLERLLTVNSKIALDNYHRYQQFHGSENVDKPALLAYTGVVFKNIEPTTFSEEDLHYVQEHLRITSFLYGLLRPMDVIRLYRLEGNVRIPELGDISLYDYWKPFLTKMFIEQIKQQEGILINLASDEMKNLFDWKKVQKEVKIITPEFKTVKDGKLKTIVIYTKMCRGRMTRFILDRRLENYKDLQRFSWEGFEYNELLSTDTNPVFTNGY